MIPSLEQAATLADNAGGALHSAAVQPTPEAVLRRALADLHAAAEIVAAALPPEAPKGKRGKR